jgi:hypothetical protein
MVWCLVKRRGNFTFTGALTPEGNWAEREAHHSPPSIAEVKNARSWTSTPQYMFTGWYLVKIILPLPTWRFHYIRRGSLTLRSFAPNSSLKAIYTYVPPTFSTWWHSTCGSLSRARQIRYCCKVCACVLRSDFCSSYFIVATQTFVLIYVTLHRKF